MTTTPYPNPFPNPKHDRRHPWAVNVIDGTTVVTFDGDPFVVAPSATAAIGAVDRLNRMGDGDFDCAHDPDAEVFAAWVVVWGVLLERLPEVRPAVSLRVAVRAVHDMRAAGFLCADSDPVAGCGDCPRDHD